MEGKRGPGAGRVEKGGVGEVLEAKERADVCLAWRAGARESTVQPNRKIQTGKRSSEERFHPSSAAQNALLEQCVSVKCGGKRTVKPN